MASANSMELHWRVGPEGLCFHSDARVQMPLSGEADHGDLLDSAAWHALQTLWEDEVASEVEPGFWRVPFNRVFEIHDETLQELGIPRAPSLDVRVAVTGIPGNSGLGLLVTTESAVHGRLEGGVAREGPFYLPHGEPPFLVERRLFEVLDIAAGGPDSESLESHLAFLARGKRAALECDAQLDRYLEREEYAFPDSVELDIRIESPEEITLAPKLPADNGPILSPEQLSQRTPGRVESVREGSRRRRLIFSQEIREQIDGVRSRHKITGSDVPRFAENPEAYLPEGIDLSHFSDRVHGIRSVTYNSRPYIHVRESSGGWFEGVPGIELEANDEDVVGAADSLPRSPIEEISPATYRELAEHARETGDEFQRHGDGWVRIDPFQADEFLAVIDRLGGIDDGVVRAPKNAILDVYENLQTLEFELSEAGGLSLPAAVDLPAVAVPTTFHGELRPYQALGFRWLANLERKGTGGLLADDMGLGKTIQVIAHLARLAKQDEMSPTLIVCPKTLIENWTREIRRFFPDLHGVTELVGSRATAEQLADRSVVIASYDTVRRGQLEIAKVDWKCVVSDETQYAKNPTAQRTSALKALKSRHRVALTGTPVENGLIEFWCIMDFVRPGLLGSWKDFRERYERPLVAASTEVERQPLVRELVDHLGPHYLRRLKEEVLRDLPEKSEHRYTTRLSDAQLGQYRRIARAAKSGGRGAALGAITHMLMVCGHPQALEPSRSRYSPGLCPKLDETLRILEGVRQAGDKALIFTRFKVLQRILRDAVREELGIWPDIVNGDLTTNRQQVVDMFQKREGFNVLILSEEVGGVGLNLTEANHVVHYTRPWNPAKENQATDRAHRFGQAKQVHVHLLVTTHPEFVTVEQRLDELLKDKSQLARDVLRPSSESKVRREELLECVAAALPDG